MDMPPFQTLWNKPKDQVKITWGPYNTIFMSTAEFALLVNDPTIGDDEPSRVLAFKGRPMPDLTDMEVTGFIVFEVTKRLREEVTRLQKLVPLEEFIKKVEVETLLRSVDTYDVPLYQPELFCQYHKPLKRGSFEIHWQCCMDVWIGSHVFSDLRGPDGSGEALSLAFTPENRTKFVGAKLYFDNEVEWCKQVLDEIS